MEESKRRESWRHWTIRHQEPMTRSLQLYCVRVTAFSQTDLFLDWISREWDSHRSPMTNYKKLSWRHRVTEPEVSPFHRRCMEVARSRWAPDPCHIKRVEIVTKWIDILRWRSRLTSSSLLKFSNPSKQTIACLFAKHVLRECMQFLSCLFHASMQPRLCHTKIGRAKVFTARRINFRLYQLKIRPRIWRSSFWRARRLNFHTFIVAPFERNPHR